MRERAPSATEWARGPAGGPLEAVHKALGTVTTRPGPQPPKLQRAPRRARGLPVAGLPSDGGPPAGSFKASLRPLRQGPRCARARRWLAAALADDALSGVFGSPGARVAAGHPWDRGSGQAAYPGRPWHFELELRATVMPPVITTTTKQQPPAFAVPRPHWHVPSRHPQGTSPSFLSSGCQY